MALYGVLYYYISPRNRKFLIDINNVAHRSTEDSTFNLQFIGPTSSRLLQLGVGILF